MFHAEEAFDILIKCTPWKENELKNKKFNYCEVKGLDLNNK